jgi:large subunit ribosomal protein L17
MHSRRIVFSNLKDKTAVTELFRDVSVKIGDRPGGYTRILRTGYRLGDAAEMCIIELVDYNENMLKEKTAKKAARTRRGKKSTAAADGEVSVEQTAAAEKPAKKAEKIEEKAEEKIQEVTNEVSDETKE